MSQKWKSHIWKCGLYIETGPCYLPFYDCFRLNSPPRLILDGWTSSSWLSLTLVVLSLFQEKYIYIYLKFISFCQHQNVTGNHNIPLWKTWTPYVAKKCLMMTWRSNESVKALAIMVWSYVVISQYSRFRPRREAKTCQVEYPDYRCFFDDFKTVFTEAFVWCNIRKHVIYHSMFNDKWRRRQPNIHHLVTIRTRPLLEQHTQTDLQSRICKMWQEFFKCICGRSQQLHNDCRDLTRIWENGFTVSITTQPGFLTYLSTVASNNAQVQRRIPHFQVK